MTTDELLPLITVKRAIFSGKTIVRGRRLAVEHVLAMVAAGDTVDNLLEGYPWLEREDVLVCLECTPRKPVELPLALLG